MGKIEIYGATTEDESVRKDRTKILGNKCDDDIR
jgi:hypothetical protein